MAKGVGGGAEKGRRRKGPAVGSPEWELQQAANGKLEPTTPKPTAEVIDPPPTPETTPVATAESAPAAAETTPDSAATDDERLHAELSEATAASAGPETPAPDESSVDVPPAETPGAAPSAVETAEAKEPLEALRDTYHSLLSRAVLIPRDPDSFALNDKVSDLYWRFQSLSKTPEKQRSSEAYKKEFGDLQGELATTAEETKAFYKDPEKMKGFLSRMENGRDDILDFCKKRRQEAKEYADDPNVSAKERAQAERVYKEWDAAFKGYNKDSGEILLAAQSAAEGIDPFEGNDLPPDFEKIAERAFEFRMTYAGDMAGFDAERSAGVVPEEDGTDASPAYAEDAPDVTPEPAAEVAPSPAAEPAPEVRGAEPTAPAETAPIDAPKGPDTSATVDRKPETLSAAVDDELSAWERMHAEPKQKGDTAEELSTWEKMHENQPEAERALSPREQAYIDFDTGALVNAGAKPEEAAVVAKTADTYMRAATAPKPHQMTVEEWKKKFSANVGPGSDGYKATPAPEPGVIGAPAASEEDLAHIENLRQAAATPKPAAEVIGVPPGAVEDPAQAAEQLAHIENLRQAAAQQAEAVAGRVPEEHRSFFQRFNAGLDSISQRWARQGWKTKAAVGGSLLGIGLVGGVTGFVPLVAGAFVGGRVMGFLGGHALTDAVQTWRGTRNEPRAGMLRIGGGLTGMVAVPWIAQEAASHVAPYIQAGLDKLGVSQGFRDYFASWFRSPVASEGVGANVTPRAPDIMDLAERNPGPGPVAPTTPAVPGTMPGAPTTPGVPTTPSAVPASITPLDQVDPSPVHRDVMTPVAPLLMGDEGPSVGANVAPRTPDVIDLAERSPGPGPTSTDSPTLRSSPDAIDLAERNPGAGPSSVDSPTLRSTPDAMDIAERTPGPGPAETGGKNGAFAEPTADKLRYFTERIPVKAGDNVWDLLTKQLGANGTPADVLARVNYLRTLPIEQLREMGLQPWNNTVKGFDFIGAQQGKFGTVDFSVLDRAAAEGKLLPPRGR